MSEAIEHWIHSILSERDPYAEALLFSEFSYSRQWFGDSADFLISHHLLFFHLSRNSFHGLVDHSMSNGLLARVQSIEPTMEGEQWLPGVLWHLYTHKNTSKIILCLLYNCQINPALFEFMLNNLRILYIFCYQ